MFTRVLVPLDGSALAERALGPAAGLARAGGSAAQLILMRAPVPTQLFFAAEGGYGLLYPEQSLAEANEAAAAYLESVRAAQATAGCAARSVLLEGDAAGAIVDAASEERADLIVMSSHGYSGLARWLLGSVAEKVLHAAPCPVLVVRSPEPITRLLVTLDGSALAEQVLGPALALACGLDLPITLLRVVPDMSARALSELDDFEHGLGQRWLQETEAEATAYLERVAAEGLPGAPRVERVVRLGPAAPVILKYAEQHASGCIGMATHGRTGLRRWIYGSVTERVLHAAPVSMLVVRPQPADLA
jgi:nucleotide-binding universal stress UspA family protein